MIILDMGSGNGMGNDLLYITDSIAAIKAIDSGKHEIVLKYQLFESAPPNVPLSQLCFDAAYTYGLDSGYQVTASVFDLESLDFLLQHKIPFVKIACRPELYDLIGEVPRKIRVFVSYSIHGARPVNNGDIGMCCISKYPATVEEYIESFDVVSLGMAISDHTVGWDLFKRFNPQVIEKHFVLDRDPKNPDAGPFAVTPEELKEVL